MGATFPNFLDFHSLVLVILLTYSVYSKKIPLTKCCASDESYVIGFDNCKTANEFLIRRYPPIYLSRVETAVEDASQIQLTFHLPTCPDGFVHSAVLTNFFLFENGSLSIPELGISRLRDQFCVDEFESFDQSLEPVLKATARFCVPDPCLGSNCIRKCCPEGMILYLSDIHGLYCRHSKAIKFDYSTINNVSKIPDDSRDSSFTAAYVIRSGALPKCQNDEFDLIPGPEENETEPFFTIKNGSAFLTGHQVSDDYCIDSIQSTSDDQITSTKLKGIRCFPPKEEPRKLDTVYPYILFVSSIFLIGTFVVYAIVPEMRNVHGLCVMCQVASSIVTFICFGTMQMNVFSTNGPLCITIAILLHFSFLSIFSWLNVISFYTWWIFKHLQHNFRSRERNATKMFLYCSIYGWGLPFLVVFIGQILDFTYDRQYDKVLGIALISDDGIIRPDFGIYRCWFPNKEALVAYFYGPIGVLIVANVILFVLTIVALCKATEDTLVARRNQAKQKFRVILSLFILMGLFWLMEVISYLVGGDVQMWIFTDIVNMLTGVFVFILFICKRTVWNRLKKRFPYLERFDAGICHPSCIVKFIGWNSSRNNGSSTGSSSDAQSNTPKIQETVTTPAIVPQLKDYFDVRVNMTQEN